MLTVDDLLDLAAHNGVRVRSADLGEISGYYDDDSRCITLDICLATYQVRSTMAHELSHARHRDRPLREPRAHKVREERADAEAARMLISPEAYAMAEAEHGPHAGAIACELGVTRKIVLAFQREAALGRAWTRCDWAEV
ncbi:hypothetical protein GCM10010401_06880 [Rarobacter faecitabidus]|uniref:Uncharacterized protein DUF955 n=1 Tax=Rarobacter faecitabidus TaxID=13243 RepID=A0A542ZT81_RARFA|nr:ImmA/IrrE family metallo-endopeptidase [Rarobacter faecitabidus]TQL63564.1 uncharacterized protein DUF955 [Rarobacter faecitabidus]